MREGERGMVKYAPYQSLTAQATALAKMRRQKQYVEKPLLSHDKAEEINQALVNYSGGDIVLVYWRAGEIRRIEGVIRKIDTTFHQIYIEDMRVSLFDIVDVEE